MREQEFREQLAGLADQLPSDWSFTTRVANLLAEAPEADEARLVDIVQELLSLLDAGDLGIAFEPVEPAADDDSWIDLQAMVGEAQSGHRAWLKDIAPSLGAGPRVHATWDLLTTPSALGARPRLSVQELNTYRGDRGPLPTITLRDGDPAEPPATTITRTPHIDVGEYATTPIPVNATIIVKVYLDTSDFAEGEDGDVAELPNVDGLRINVNLTVSSHFTVDGLSTGTLVVRTGSPRSDDATFSLTCRRADADVAGVAATLFHEWRPVGTVSRKLTVTGSPVPRAFTSPVPAPEPNASVEIPSEPVTPADLTITVDNSPDGNENHYTLTVCSPHLPALSAGVSIRWNLPSRTRDMVTARMSSFLNRSPGGRVAALRGSGIELFLATPQEFQDAFWSLVDHAAADAIELRTIYVVTAEPHIPWELMIPTRDGDEDRAPLGIDYAVGRWVNPRLVSPKQTAPITDSWVIAPDYLPPDVLNFSAAEAAFVIDNFNGRRLAPALIMNINQQLATRGASLLHFICHGVSGESAQVLKLDPDEQLTDGQLRGLSGVVRAMRKDHPFVFINACQVGQTVPALAGSAGFAAKFAELGARAVVAPLWSVRDEIAAQVTREFYERIKADPTVPYAAVLQDIRRKSYEGDDPEDSYAAYCFYGDPHSAQEVAR